MLKKFESLAGTGKIQIFRRELLLKKTQVCLFHVSYIKVHKDSQEIVIAYRYCIR